MSGPPPAGGSWVARRFVGDGRYIETKVGTADDLQDADGAVIHDFRQAQEAARGWWRIEERKAQGIAPSDGPYTVVKALEDYFADRERRGSKGVAKDRSASNIRIIPVFGTVELAKLTTKRIRDWHTGLASASKLSRPPRFMKDRKSQKIDPKDPDTVRARRATANRTLTVLKAALNHAFHDGHIATDEAWRKVKPFREVDAPIVRYLSDDECRRIVNACEGNFRDLVRGALLTGCRYGELTRMRAGDFNAAAGTITVQVSKSGKPRHVALTDDGKTLFTNLTAGRTGRELVFVRDDGETWGPSHQQRPLDRASSRAQFKPAATFHILRHTYASTLAMNGVPMGVIAAQLGHADTRITEKHYAHLSPNYVAETVRAALPSLGIIEETNVRRINGREREEA
jgi:integrase